MPGGLGLAIQPVSGRACLVAEVATRRSARPAFVHHRLARTNQIMRRLADVGRWRIGAGLIIRRSRSSFRRRSMRSRTPCSAGWRLEQLLVQIAPSGSMVYRVWHRHAGHAVDSAMAQQEGPELVAFAAQIANQPLHRRRRTRYVAKNTARRHRARQTAITTACLVFATSKATKTPCARLGSATRATLACLIVRKSGTQLSVRGHNV